jgi:hypothetical protein
MLLVASLTQEILKQVLRYEPDTGDFYWASPPDKSKSRLVGSKAGCVCRGYVVISVYGKQHGAHRLAWLYMTGEMPAEIDHINRVRGDNRFCNLRSVTHADNTKNVSARTGTVSGHQGVAWHPRNNRWQVYVGRRYIGVFKTLDEAVAARVSASLDLYGEFSPHKEAA